MRFWIGLFISLVGGLIGIGLFRELIKSQLTMLVDLHLDIFSLVILITGLIITAIDHSKQSINLKNLENEQKGRTLETKQRESLKESFKKLPKTKVELISIQGDRESFRFAKLIKEIMIESSWDVDGVWEDIILGGVGSGILIRQKSSEPNSIGGTISHMMNENNINARTVEMTNFDSNQIQIIVGSRP